MDSASLGYLRLTLTPGLGPVLIRRLVDHAGSPEAALESSESTLACIKGISRSRAPALCRALRESARLAEDETALAADLGVRFISVADAEYPPLLAQIPDPPPVLYVLGELRPAAADQYPFAIVGSRSCTPYGHEQAARFALHLAQAGLTIVSGGARGIDSAAHRGSLRAGPTARTIAVLGCGLAHRYPPDNAELFDQIIDGRGALISELPLRTSPSPENFPARNRIISGLSLGVLVIEAGRRSGALITARDAAEDHGREVFALPGRVDSASSEGSLALLKSGGAALVTHPADILEALESPARHLFQGTHSARYGGNATPAPGEDAGESGLFETSETSAEPLAPNLTPAQQAILGALDEPRTIDDLAPLTGLAPAALRSELTILEIMRRVRREGSRIARISPARAPGKSASTRSKTAATTPAGAS